MDNLNDEKMEALRLAVERTRGIEREFGSFTASIDDELNIHVRAKHGWEIIYPKGNEIWTYLLYWLDTWNEGAQSAIEAFFSGLVFPTAVRLGDIDEDYMRDIVSAHNNLTLRNLDRGVPKYEEDADEEDEESEDNDNNDGDGSAEEENE